MTQPADNPFINRDDLLKMIRAEFVAYSAARGQDYNALRNKVNAAIGDAADPASPAGIIARRQHDGMPAACAYQILLELGWLAKYCTDWDAADERLAALRAALAAPDTIDPVQVADGSWGGCIREPYRKLEPTVDALQALPDNGPAPGPLTFMADLRDAKKTLDRLWRLQVTDIRATGRNNRDELGALQTALSQLIFKDSLREVLAEQTTLAFDIPEELEDDYIDYLSQTQSPRTGYWGPWYRIDGKLLQVQDLSFTFHVVNYRAGVVERWPTIIDTTLAIEKLVYPAGWAPTGGAKYSQHNNYDVAALFAYGWPHMTANQKTAVRGKIGEMLGWCLGTSMDATGFRSEAGYSITDTYYYGVRFLDKVGFWDPSKRFWYHRPPEVPAGTPAPGDLAARLSATFEALNDRSAESATVRAILKTAACMTGGAAPPDNA